MPLRRKPVAIATAALLLALGVGAWIGWPYISTAAFLLDIAGAQGGVRRLIPIRSHPVRTTDFDVPTRYGPIPVRLYAPDGASRAVAVFPGVHGGGVDEPRLVQFCQRLAATGLTVLSVPLPDLRLFRVTARSADMIEDATRWLSEQRTLAPDGRVALVGVSFGGGLALVAAGRPSLANRLKAVIAIGGYGDLPRTLHYLCTGRLPDGEFRAPHDYGLAVVALDAASSLVPAAQQAGFEAAVLTYLRASLDDSPSQAVAKRLMADARQQLQSLPEPSRSIVNAVLTRDVARLGRRLNPLIDELASNPALSPERSPATRAPVFLLHASDDNVIPPSETPLLGAYLSRMNPHVRWLVTPALAHAGVHQHVSAGEWWQLVRFWKALRDEMGD
jgi:dienelactone hydrolase